MSQELFRASTEDSSEHPEAKRKMLKSCGVALALEPEDGINLNCGWISLDPETGP